MAIQLNSLMGVTLLRANRVLTVEDNEHESEIERGSLFGIRQVRKRFYILDIDVKPLEIYAFEVSKTQYLRYASQGTLLTEKDIPKFIPAREIRKAFKPMLSGDPLSNEAPRNAQFFDNDLTRILINTFDGVPAIDYQLDDNRDMTLTPANTLSVKIAYDDDADTVRKFVRSRIAQVLNSPRFDMIAVEPKVLKKDSDIVAVTGAGIIKLVNSPDKYGLVRKGQFSPLEDFSRHQYNARQANVSEMRMINSLNTHVFKGTNGIVMDKASGKFYLDVPKAKAKKVLAEFCANMVRHNYELRSGTGFDGKPVINVIDKDNHPDRLELSLGDVIDTDIEVSNIIVENSLLDAVYEDYIKQDVPIVSKVIGGNLLVLDGSKFTLDEIKEGAFLQYSEAGYDEEDRDWKFSGVERDGSVVGTFLENEYSEQRPLSINIKFTGVLAVETAYTFMLPVLRSLAKGFKKLNYNAKVYVGGTKGNYDIGIVTGYNDEDKFDDGSDHMEVVLQTSKEFRDYLGLDRWSFIPVMTATNVTRHDGYTVIYTNDIE